MTPDRAPRYTDDDTDVVLPRPYDDYDPERVFTITGHIVNEYNEMPLETRVRVVSSKTFPNRAAARKWCLEKYGHIYKDVSQEDFGMWGFVVPKPGAP